MPEDERPTSAFYTLAPGGWRDYWSLLHPPYTLWHLSYVAMGAAIAPGFRMQWLLEALLAFFLAMGVAAHALDELSGRPLGTRIPSGVLVGLAVIGLLGAVALGVHGVVSATGWLAVCIPVGAFLVVAYNLESFSGLFHSDLWFALAWGGFPVITAYLAQAGTIRLPAVALAAACVGLSAAQRTLSTPVRHLRRNVAEVRGTVVLRDGTQEELTDAALRAAPERALKLLSLTVPLLALAAVLTRI
ncbi:MAG: hypothetical protein QOF65_2945 [Thermoleophilaceae bacterium]|nr:hypothetical protein [Thermoleophilaceae bacterium]